MAESRVVLSIGGVDPSAGAGVYADLDTIRDHGLLGTAVVAAVTAQSSRAFLEWRPVAPALLARQLEAVLGDLPPAALKIGMLGAEASVAVVEEALARRTRVPMVLDPVLVSTTGGSLSRDVATRALAARLVGLATVVTPNAAEATALTGVPAFGRAGMAAAARALVENLGAAAVVVTGGDASDTEPARGPGGRRGPGERRARGRAAAGEVVDCLLERGGRPVWLSGARVAPPGGARAVRGTGCRFATAIACGLALGHPLPAAVRAAKRYVARLIATRAVRVGQGAAQVGPGRREGG